MKKALPTISIVGHLKRFYYGPLAQNRTTLTVRLPSGQCKSKQGRHQPSLLSISAFPVIAGSCTKTASTPEFPTTRVKWPFPEVSSKRTRLPAENLRSSPSPINRNLHVSQINLDCPPYLISNNNLHHFEAFE